MKGYFVLSGKGKNVLETIHKINETFKGTGVKIVDIMKLYNEDRDFRLAIRRMVSGTKERDK